MKATEVRALIDRFGEDYTLEQLFNSIGRPYTCPKCAGYGYKLETYDAYPQGLPDSGWATDIKTKRVDCDICNGHGYTPKKLKPRVETKIIGYEEE